jgi:hypothetical protein
MKGLLPLCLSVAFLALAVSGCGPDSSLGDTWTRPADDMVMV